MPQALKCWMTWRCSSWKMKQSGSRKKNTTSRITRHLVAVLKTFHSDFLVLKNRGADLETSYSLNVFYLSVTYCERHHIVLLLKMISFDGKFYLTKKIEHAAAKKGFSLVSRWEHNSSLRCFRCSHGYLPSSIILITKCLDIVLTLARASWKRFRPSVVNAERICETVWQWSFWFSPIVFSKLFGMEEPDMIKYLISDFCQKWRNMTNKS